MRLTWKILLFTGALVVALVAGTLAFTTVQADRLARTTVLQGLAETREVWQALQADRFDKLRIGVRVLANDPPFKAALIETDTATALDTMRERGLDLGADFVLATDAEGRLVARSDRPGAAGEDLSADAIVRRALEGGESATLWRQHEQLFTAVAVPMAIGPELVGTLVAGYRIDDRAAAQVRRLTHSDVAFLLGAGGQRPALAASSLGGRDAVLQAVLARPEVSSGTEPFDLELGGERLLALRIPMANAAGEEIGAALALRSVTAETAPFRRFRSSLVMVSSGVVVLALLLATFGAARVTGPLRKLVALVEGIRDGSYQGAVQVSSTDEVGVLARAFNALVADLRQRDQVIAFLRASTQDPSRETVATQDRGGAATLALPAGGATSPTSGLSSSRLDPGAMFAGRYEILEALGRGGMGIVYRARDRQLDEPVALKLIRSEGLASDPSLRERLKQELKLARRITHRNVVRTHDFGETDGVPYISMEYVSGVTLKQLVSRRGPLPLAVGLSVAKQLAHGLGAAHEQGVVHRDVKSQNVLIVPETGEIKVMDFGIARTSSVGQEAGGLTQAGALIGTPDYMSPEQAQGRPADVRSDIYSLCVVLFEAFTGKLPFRGEPLAVVLAHVQQRPPAPRSFAPALPASLEAIILRGLEKDPARRFADTDALVEALSTVPERIAA